MIKFDLTSYRSSIDFKYIVDDFLIIKELFETNISRVLDDLESTDKSIENERTSLVGEHLEPEFMELYIEQLKNTSLQNYFIKGGLLYYYAQFEMSLYSICERLPIHTKSETIDEYIKREKLNSKKELHKISQFILTYTGIKIKDLEYWNKISDFNEIRNSIAHNGKYSNKKINKIKTITEKHKGIIDFYESSQTLIIKKPYLMEIVKVAYDYLEKVITEIWDNRHYPKKCVS